MTFYSKPRGCVFVTFKAEKTEPGVHHNPVITMHFSITAALVSVILSTFVVEKPVAEPGRLRVSFIVEEADKFVENCLPQGAVIKTPAWMYNEVTVTK